MNSKRSLSSAWPCPHLLRKMDTNSWKEDCRARTSNRLRRRPSWTEMVNWFWRECSLEHLRRKRSEWCWNCRDFKITSDRKWCLNEGIHRWHALLLKTKHMGWDHQRRSLRLHSLRRLLCCRTRLFRCRYQAPSRRNQTRSCHRRCCI